MSASEHAKEAPRKRGFTLDQLKDVKGFEQKAQPREARAQDRDNAQLRPTPPPLAMPHPRLAPPGMAGARPPPRTSVKHRQ